jgi:hypothetical protein
MGNADMDNMPIVSEPSPTPSSTDANSPPHKPYQNLDNTPYYNNTLGDLNTNQRKRSHDILEDKPENSKFTTSSEYDNKADTNSRPIHEDLVISSTHFDDRRRAYLKQYKKIRKRRNRQGKQNRSSTTGSVASEDIQFSGHEETEAAEDTDQVN